MQSTAAQVHRGAPLVLVGMLFWSGSCSTKQASNDTRDKTNDFDGDGWSSTEDCNDQDASVYPGAEEVCDGIDQNCDGISDDAAVDAPVWYRDRDGDGFGTSEATRVACLEPDGWVSIAGDCDDLRSDVHPNGDEVCDGVDNNCDGSADGDDAIGAVECFTDIDGDGYGAGAALSRACICPSGSTEASGDCDDHDSTQNPGAVEQWYDGADSNCDGADDFDADRDGYQGPSGIGDDCSDENPEINPGVAELCGNGWDDDCSGASLECGLEGGWTAADAETTIAGPTMWANPGFGEVISALDDDGDGVQDILVSATLASPSGLDYAGVAYLFRGPLSGHIPASAANATIEGTWEDAWMTVTPAVGDFNGDGYDDAVMWSMTRDDSDVARMLGFLGPLNSMTGEPDFTVSLTENSSCVWPHTGTIQPATGATSVFVASCLDSVDGLDEAGTVRSFAVAAGGDLESGDAEFELYGDAPNSNFGLQVDARSDFNGDGIVDIVVAGLSGGDSSSSIETLWLFEGPVSTATSSDATSVYSGPHAVETWGPVQAGGDSDGDGLPEIAAVSYEADGLATGSGVVWVLSPVLGADRFLEDDAIRVDGVDAEAGPTCVLWIPDEDGDRRDELLVGVRSAPSSTKQGKAYLLTGPLTSVNDLSANRGTVLGTGNSYLGGSCAWMGDTNHDGFGEFAIGARGDLSLGSSGGAVFLFSVGPGQ